MHLHSIVFVRNIINHQFVVNLIVILLFQFIVTTLCIWFSAFSSYYHVSIAPYFKNKDNINKRRIACAAPEIIHNCARRSHCISSTSLSLLNPSISTTNQHSQGCAHHRLRSTAKIEIKILKVFAAIIKELTVSDE